MPPEEQAVRREARHAADKNYRLRHSNRLAADARLCRQLAAKAKADHQCAYPPCPSQLSTKLSLPVTRRYLVVATTGQAVREVLHENDDNSDDAEQTANGGDDHAINY
ncbi:hypothetical protein B0H14DRAFT_3477066 [Mycena olivaceomarginata]|nr:hypothetical protein B0H14DRAFT_3477066 [Mycena olivaceomarginata]